MMQYPANMASLSIKDLTELTILYCNPQSYNPYNHASHL